MVCIFRLLLLSDARAAHITGCYAPEGDHAEKLIENGLKANTGIISVYEAKRTTSVPAAAVPKGQKGGTQADKDKANDVPEIGGEIENIEVIFTDQVCALLLHR